MESPQPDTAESSAGEQHRRSGAPLLALTAILLSLAALAVSVFEVSAIRDEQRIQVWPYIQIETRYGPEGFRLTLHNKGIGPARVRTVAVSYQGRDYRNLDELILNTVGADNAFSYDVYSTSNPERSVVSPDEEVVLFGVPWEPRTRLLVERWNGEIEVAICFCSVYDDCWVSRLGPGEPQPVEHCPAP